MSSQEQGCQIKIKDFKSSNGVKLRVRDGSEVVGTLQKSIEFSKS